MLLCPQLRFFALWLHKSSSSLSAEATPVSAAASSWLRGLWSPLAPGSLESRPNPWLSPPSPARGTSLSHCTRMVFALGSKYGSVTQCLLFKKKQQKHEFLGILLSCGELLRVCWTLEQTRSSLLELLVRGKQG